jgi:hypothetical protein
MVNIFATTLEILRNRVNRVDWKKFLRSMMISFLIGLGIFFGFILYLFIMYKMNSGK